MAPTLADVLAGAGFEGVAVTPELANSFGQILRVVVSGLMDVLHARQQIKEEFRLRLTHFRPADNNPLKFSANADDALHNLLIKRNAAYLGPGDLAGHLPVSASALCGAAQDIPQLVVCRALAQGIGAGGLMTLAFVAVGLLVSPRERGRYQGYIAAGVRRRERSAGPLIGGALVGDVVSWRWVFMVNLPLGAAALAGLGQRRCPRGRLGAARAPLDVAGAVLVAAAAGALLLACVGESAAVVGRRRGSAGPRAPSRWSPRERRAADPVVPLSLLATPCRRDRVRRALPRDRRGCSRSSSSSRCSCRRRGRHARPRPGCCSAPMMLGGTVVATTVAGRGSSRAPGATSASRCWGWAG